MATTFTTPILVISGPSGVGKSTLLNKLFDKYPSTFGFSASHTTRSPRPGEVDGVAYNFTTREAMLQDIKDGKFLESAEFSGNLYGTSFAAVKKVQDENKICVMDLELNGIKNIKKLGIAAKFIFISPPSIEDLETRLRGRGTETEESLAKRLASAQESLDYAKEPNSYDVVIVNEDAEKAGAELESFVVANWKIIASTPVAPAEGRGGCGVGSDKGGNCIIS